MMVSVHYCCCQNTVVQLASSTKRRKEERETDDEEQESKQKRVRRQRREDKKQKENVVGLSSSLLLAPACVTDYSELDDLIVSLSFCLLSFVLPSSGFLSAYFDVILRTHGRNEWLDAFDEVSALCINASDS